MRRVRLGVILLSVLPAVALAGQVFEWRDASGNRHFSDQPPPGVDAKPVGIRTNTPQSKTPPAGGAPDKPEDAPKTWAEKNEDFTKRRAEQSENEAKAREEAEQVARRNAACEQARANLKLLESGRRVQRMDPESGERVVLDDAAREEEMARARKNIEQACK